MALSWEGPPADHGLVVTSAIVATTAVATTNGLAALADPIRLAIIGVLADGERCVCELHERVPVAANLLSYHLRVLRAAGLLQATRRGRFLDYRLDGDRFATLWAELAATGVPMPGQVVAAGRAGPSCRVP
jgi:ArsR family transcriptional regulator